MGKASGIIAWFKTCPLVADVEEFDINQLSPQDMMAGLYKQPAITKEELNDGSEIVTEFYYILFRKSAQIRLERLDNEEFVEAVESWISTQDFAGNYPDIGHDVYGIKYTNAFVMLERDSESAVYQLTISIKFMKEVKYD